VKIWPSPPPLFFFASLFYGTLSCKTEGLPGSQFVPSPPLLTKWGSPPFSNNLIPTPSTSDYAFCLRHYFFPFLSYFPDDKPKAERLFLFSPSPFAVKQTFVRRESAHSTNPFLFSSFGLQEECSNPPFLPSTCEREIYGVKAPQLSLPSVAKDLANGALPPS